MSKKGHILHEELSYAIRGIFYTVHNYLGNRLNEQLYCDGIEQGLRVHNIQYEREKQLQISFVGERKGRNRVDFLIEEKILVEVKATPTLTRKEYDQCHRYLSVSDYELLFLVNFRPRRLIIKRILNPKNLNR